MSQRLRFGILGTGNIARQFADGLAGATESTLAAVASRSGEKAAAFAAGRGEVAAHGSYEALLADPRVDAVYVSLPNAMHHAWTLAALRAGKHVLCEKPLASTAAEAEEMFDVARRSGRLLVEAFMYRSHPLLKAVYQRVASGAIGPLHLIRTSFCYRTRKIDGNVRFSAELAGGALMDIGCYCVSFARWIAGREPRRIAVHAALHESGVDELASGSLDFGDGLQASFICGMCVQADNAAALCGEEGYLTIPVPWKPLVQGAVYEFHTMTPPRQDAAAAAGPVHEVISLDAGKPLYALEADEFAQAVAGTIPVAVTEADSIGNMRVLDELRRQAGLRF